jgi:choice-of-anchor C domain-containing protein
MKRRSMVGAATGLVASIALAGSALAAFAGATNGSFETGTYVDNGSGFEMLSATSTDITGWTVASGTIDWVGAHWQAQDGAMSLDLDGNAPGSISQTLATTVGNSYLVNFFLAGNPDGAPVVKTLTVSATGAAPATYIFDVSTHSTSAMGWTAEQYSFVATSASSTLTFASGDTASAFGPALDNVVVTETAAAEKNDCKNDGWQTMKDRLGNGFKNQGDCVSYFATGGKNLGSVTSQVPASAAQPRGADRADPADRPRHAKSAKAAPGGHHVSLDGSRGHTIHSSGAQTVSRGH